MKEFVLTQPYGTLDEMLNSGEVAVYKEELQQGLIDEYALVSRIGNRYNLNGNRIEGYVPNPFYKQQELNDFCEKEEEKSEVIDMKYTEIEALIDNEVAKALDKAKVEHAKDIALLNEQHEKELAEAKQNYASDLAKVKDAVKAELLAKLNS